MTEQRLPTINFSEVVDSANVGEVAAEPDPNRQAMAVKINITRHMKDKLAESGLFDKDGQLTLPDNMSDQVISYFSGINSKRKATDSDIVSE